MTFDSSFGLVGIFLYCLSCRNVWKTYEKKSKFYRIRTCIILFFAGFILAIGFLFLLNPKMSAYALGKNSWLFLGLFSEIISLFLRFRETKKHHKNSSREYKSVRNKLILTISIPIVLFLFFYEFNFYKNASCQYPMMLIGDECCVPNTDFGFPICNDEAVEMNQQSIYAIENDLLTIEKQE